MKRIPNCATAGGLLALLLLSFPAIAAPCPSSLPGNNGNFTFESWLEPNKSKDANLSHRFGGTITNNGAPSLFIDWPEVGFRGHVPMKETKKVSISAPLGDCEVVDADLWWGDRPTLLPGVKAVRPAGKTFLAELARAARTAVLDLFAKDGKVYSSSVGDLFVPLDDNNPPKQFASFKVEFLSEVAKGDYKLTLILDVVAEQRGFLKGFFAKKTGSEAIVTAVFEDPFVARGFKVVQFSYRKADLDEGKPGYLFQRATLASQTQPPSYRVSRLLFLDGAGRLIGTMPISVIDPQTSTTEAR